MKRVALINSVLATFSLAGCGFAGLNAQPLPFAAGNGGGAQTITVVMADAGNLVPNSEVKIDDVTVGSVRHITFDHWHAILEVGLNKGTQVPADATATIGQKSLLGAEYVELAAPANTTASAGQLKSGATIPIERTGRYPDTEEVLAAVSAVLNGGGIEQVQTITTELNKMLGGRETTVRDMVGQVSRLAGTLDQQRTNIVDALGQLNRTADAMRGQQTTIASALVALPRAVNLVNSNEQNIVRLLNKLQAFSAVASRFETTSKASLSANLHHLHPVMTQLAAAGKALTGFLADPLISFPTDGALRSVKGDYMNLFLTVDLTTTALSRDWLTGTPLAGLFGSPLTTPHAATKAGPLPLLGGLTNLLPPSLSTGRPSSPASPGTLGGLLNGLLGGDS